MTATAAPSAASALATAAPIPLDAPVMIATLPANFFISKGKSGEGRNFPLIPELRAVLAEQLERTAALELATDQIIPWLFHKEGKSIGSFRKAWASACKRAGIAGKIPHDFRRTAVRNLERAGVPRSAAMAMVGHQTESIYRRYAIADDGMLKEGAIKTRGVLRRREK
jgi:integrase